MDETGASSSAIGVVGLGLIGGSIAFNLAQDFDVVGYDVDPAIRREALSRGAITSEATSLAAMGGLKLIFVATPPGTVVPIVVRLSETLRPDAIVSDCAGSKSAIVDAISTGLPQLAPRFVGGHPMAGRERGGLAQARIDLFQGASWILTPGPETEPRALAMLTGLVPTFGAHPVLMDPESHDEAVALFSHLPHILAGELVQMSMTLTRRDVGAGSWADLTRVAGADPVLWTDIVMANRRFVSQSVRDLTGRLSKLVVAIERGERDVIRAFFEAALHARDGKGE